MRAGAGARQERSLLMRKTGIMSERGGASRSRQAVLTVAAALALVIGFDPSMVMPLAPWLAAGAEPSAADETREENLRSAFERLQQTAPVDGTAIDGAWPEPPEPEFAVGPTTLPDADEETVQLAGASTFSATGAGVEVDLGGMTAVVAPAEDGSSPESVTVRVADAADAAAAGVDGLLLEVEDAAGGAAPTADAAVSLQLSYAAFSGLGGGDWASRLRFVHLPACAPDAAATPECAPIPVPTVNDPVTQTISAEVPVAGPAVVAPPSGEPAPGEPGAETPEGETPDTETPATDAPTATPPATETPATDAPPTEPPATDTPATETPASDAPASDAPDGDGELAARAADRGAASAVRSTTLTAMGGAARLGVFADVAGPRGDWSATSLSPTSTWSTSGATGGFAWSYPMRVPAVPAGPSPQLAISYSSATSDGRIPSANNQSGWVGEGFDVPGGFVERNYRACTKDDGGAANNAGRGGGDLCWGPENATLVFKGAAVELIKGSGDRWLPKHDDGTRVELLHGAWNAGERKEYWKVTTVDGTQYFFGRGKRSADDVALNSAWTVPVYGNHAGEACREPAFAESRCDQVWRWNLDYVVDASGNSMTYFYSTETNRYVYDYTVNGTATVPYTSGGTLARIEYGTRAGQERTSPAPAKVEFTTAPRCVLDISNPAGLCAPGQAGPDSKTWPDTPIDLECKVGETCTTGAPVFFDRHRLAKISTWAHDGSGYRPVDSWALGQRFVAQGDGIGPKDATGAMLRLESIRHTGHGGTDATADDVQLPPNRFVYTGMKNRIDAADDGQEGMERHRLTNVRTEAGASISVDYRTSCAPGDVPGTSESAQRTNDRLCFPVRWQPSGEANPRIDYFHKYVVKSIVETAAPSTAAGTLLTKSVRVETAYTYSGGAGWAKPTGAALIPEDLTYSEFRGFPTVTTTVGTGDEASVSQTSYYRGLGGTLTAGPSGAGVTTNDHERYRGEVFASVSKDGDHLVSEQVTTHGAPVVVATGAGGREATRVPSTTVDGFVYDAAGALDRHTRVASTFDANSQLRTVDDRGDLALTTDDVCTTTTYAHDTAPAFVTAHRVALPAKSERVSVACGQTVSRPAHLVGSERFEYDGVGRLLRAFALDPDDPQGATFELKSEVRSYDERGRALVVADAAGQLTTTAYQHSPGGLLARTSVTTPDVDGPGPLGGATTATALNPLTGTVSSSTDANGRITSASYDALGRRTAVRYPQHPAPGPASVVYEYTVPGNGLNAVLTRTVGADGMSRHTAVVFYDGLLRPFQTQTEGADAGEKRTAGAADRGRMATHTIFDSVGRVHSQTGQWFATGAPTVTAIEPPDVAPSSTTFEYDGAGRTTDEIFWVGTSSNPAYEKWRTSTVYDGSRTLVIPPLGAVPTESRVDARGKTVSLTQYERDPETSTATTAAQVRALTQQTTTYEYDPAGQLVKMTDAEENVWTYAYDWAGQRTAATDPDSGTTSSTYDELGRVVTATNGAGETLAYTYDPLGRRTSMRDGSVTGAVRAEWQYDQAVDESGRALIGPVSSATRITPAGLRFTNETRVYDAAYRPLEVATVLPAVAPYTSLSTTEFTTSYTYTADGQPAQTRLPGVSKQGVAKPVLGSEVVTTNYDTASRPSWMGGGFGWGVYVAESRYRPDGRLQQADLGNTFGTAVTYEYEDGTNRLVGVALDRERVNNTELDLEYRYDPAGNVTAILDRPKNTALTGAAKQDNQCFGYDGLRRLDLAWTAADANCDRRADQVAPNLVGGAAPYWVEYEFDPVGNRTGKSVHATDGTSGVVTTSYTHGGGGAGVHAVTGASVSVNGGAGVSSSYGYDGAGRMVSRTEAGVSSQLGWDAESELVSLQSGGSGASGGSGSSFVYSADGDRVVRSDASGVTVYLPGGQEVSISASGAVSAARYYGFGGATVAVRVGRGLAGVSSLVSDAHGTPVASVPNTKRPDMTKVDRMYTDPFGAARGTSGAATVPGDRQFLGLTRDGSGLTLLGARYYDETLGRFLSVDPLLDLADPQQWNGYAYANNNPTSMSDPSGLRPIGTTDYENDVGGRMGSGYAANEIIAARDKVPPTVTPPVGSAVGEGCGCTNASTGQMSDEELERLITTVREIQDLQSCGVYFSPQVGCGRNGAAEDKFLLDTVLLTSASALEMVATYCMAKGCPAAGAGVAALRSATIRVPSVLRVGDLKLAAVPKGAIGTPVKSGKGLEYMIAKGTPELADEVASIRIMNPVTSGKYQYPNGYAVYMNSSGQTINPLTGRTIGRSDPFAHIPLP
ncbi:RHS repeat-associated core domain-containing protein [Agromyces mediolanus]|uniref:RHS repeat-associated core domain-containing protein n=2 Tax=Agromyces mediolanus TaxID=41986 RepID=UPI00383425A2